MFLYRSNDIYVGATNLFEKFPVKNLHCCIHLYAPWPWFNSSGRPRWKENTDKKANGFTALVSFTRHHYAWGRLHMSVGRKGQLVQNMGRRIKYQVSIQSFSNRVIIEGRSLVRELVLLDAKLYSMSLYSNANLSVAPSHQPPFEPFLVYYETSALTWKQFLST